MVVPRQDEEEEEEKKRLKGLGLLFVIVVSFLICWLVSFLIVDLVAC